VIRRVVMCRGGKERGPTSGIAYTKLPRELSAPEVEGRSVDVVVRKRRSVVVRMVRWMWILVCAELWSGRESWRGLREGDIGSCAEGWEVGASEAMLDDGGCVFVAEVGELRGRCSFSSGNLLTLNCFTLQMCLT